MAHSIELVLDDGADAAIRREWAALADAGLPSLAHHRSPTNRPHVTLTAAARLGSAADAALSDVARALPIPCRIGAPMVFGRNTVTLVRLVVPSADLLRLHSAVAEHLALHGMSDAYPHTAPGAWTPHVTLCRRLRVADLPAALECTGPELPAHLAAMRRWDGDARVEHALERGLTQG